MVEENFQNEALAAIVLTAPGNPKIEIDQNLTIIAESLEDQSYRVSIIPFETMRFEFSGSVDAPPETRPDLIVIDLRHGDHDLEAVLSACADLQAQNLPVLFLALQSMVLTTRLCLHKYGAVVLFQLPLQSPKAAIRQVLHHFAVYSETRLRQQSLLALDRKVPEIDGQQERLRILLVGAPGKRSLGLITALEKSDITIIAAMSPAQCVQYLEAAEFDGLIYFSNDDKAGFPGLLRLVRRRDRFAHLPTFLMRKGKRKTRSQIAHGADFCYDPKDEEALIIAEISEISRRYQKFRKRQRFLLGTKAGETRPTRPLCSRAFFELHLARQCLESDRSHQSLSLILLHFAAEPAMSAGGWQDNQAGLSRVLSEASAYGAMLCGDIHLAGRLQKDLLAISMPDANLADADRLAAKIRDVLSQMAFRGAGKPFRVSLSLSCVQRREGETMMMLLARAKAMLAEPVLLPADITGKSTPRPELTLVR